MESLDTLFDLFGRERRRYALYALDAADGPLEVEELAARVRRREAEVDGVSPGAFEDVVLSLRHTHLPRAAEAEYVEYDPAGNEIRVTGEPAEFRIVLAVSEALEDPGEGRTFDPADLTPGEFLAEFTSSGRAGD